MNRIVEFILAKDKEEAFQMILSGLIIIGVGVISLMKIAVEE